ncbi:alpha beta-hydrolase [Coniophora puteana RWD-64-598 SS2]|uniref:Alpha beta-hydrolase n=1 Tax=Coniophora puteana (strain RWD-64-598) TaxID=741705 RepID=R7SFI4_CONPW|nr:alpha beta-hydrolase [Coniophora puteana RWD-64-598 SS2]EIW74502.1 alpha beta-hydrolase [Coniophora puteana RWD-64-598 SS2]
MAPIPNPYKISVSDAKLSWITERIKSAHVIPDVEHPTGQEWADGPPSTVVQDLVDFWRDSYDWRKVEAQLNVTFPMFTVPIEDPQSGQVMTVHFVHKRSSRPNAVPLLYVHGWPGSFVEVSTIKRFNRYSSSRCQVEGILERLTEPEEPNTQAFHVVAPSIPGFTFGAPPTRSGFTVLDIAFLFNKLMVDVLGYRSYIAQGGDWGAGIIRTLATEHPLSCIAAHTNFPQAFGPPSPLKHPIAFLWVITQWFSASEKARFDRMMAWFKGDMGYAFIQGEKPQTISYALLDSPVGMLTWIYDKVYRLVDREVFTWEKERIITWTMLYLVSENAAHARIYKDNMATVGEVKVVGRGVPFGVSAFPHDTGYVPRWWAQVSVAENITFWREHERGGHYPTLECPDLFVKDIRDFMATVPKECLAKLQA